VNPQGLVTFHRGRTQVAKRQLSPDGKAFLSFGRRRPARQPYKVAYLGNGDFLPSHS
jgi:hypothetical protein